MKADQSDLTCPRCRAVLVPKNPSAEVVRCVACGERFHPEASVPSIGTRYTVVAIPSGVRLSADSTVLELSHTDAEAVGSVLKAVAREGRASDPIARMRSDRDALTEALNILHSPLDNS